MENMTTREAELLGELLAYRLAFKAAITGHPFAHLLHGRIQIEREKGVAVFLAEPGPEAVIASFELVMDQIAAMLPAAPPST